MDTTENLIKTSSNRQLQDVGYSSGENSVYEALNSLGRYFL